MALNREGVQQGVYGERTPHSLAPPGTPPPPSPSSGGAPIGTIPIRPVGTAPGDKDLRLISGFDGLLSHLSAVNEEVRKTLREARTLSMRTATYGSGGPEAKRTAYDMYGGAMPVSGFGNQPNVPISALGIPTAFNGMTIASRVATPPPGAGAVTEATPEPNAPAAEAAGKGAVKEDHTLRDIVIGNRLGGGRRESPEEAAAKAQEEEKRGLASSRHSGEQQYHRYSHLAEKGNLSQQIGRMIRTHTEQHQLKQAGLVADPKTGLPRHAPGTPGAGAPATKSEISAVSEGGGLMGKAGQVGAGLEEGEGIGGALAGAGGGGAAAAVGLPVAAVLAANKAVNFATEQRKQNAQWQQIMGGSNAEGFKERIGSKLFGFSQKGFMGGGEAEKLYQGVAEIGYRGTAERGAAQEFGLNNYSRYGMSVDDSLKLMKTAAGTGQEALVGLSKALDGVTRSAREAGLSAHQYQQKFASTFAATSLTTGPSQQGTAPALAGGITSSLAKMGPEFQNVTLDPLVKSEQLRRVQAAESGLTLNQFTGLSPTQRAGAIDKHLDRVANDYLTPAIKTKIDTYRNQHLGKDGKGTLSAAQIDELAADILKMPEAMDVAALAKRLNTEGAQGITEQNAWQFVIRRYLGPASVSAETKKEVASSHPKTTDPGKKDKGADKQTRAKAKTDKGYQAEVKAVGLDPSDPKDVAGDPGGISTGKKKQHDTARAYLKQQTQTGVRSPIVEALLQRHNTSDRFTVHDKGGKERTVSLHDAIDHYYDQLVSGEAVVEHGAGQGTSVSHAAGVGPQTKEAIDQAKKHETGSSRGARKKIEDSKKDTKGGSGSVKIDLSTEAKRMLKITTGGNAYQSNAGYTGAPPDPQTNPTDYPTGGP